MTSIDLTSLTPKPLKEELERIQAEAVDAGSLSEWESGFMSDIIRRGKRLSPKQADIVYRIIGSTANAVKIASAPESGDDEPHIRILKRIDLKSQDLSNWERRFMTDMKGRMLRNNAFSDRQKEIIMDMPGRMGSAADARARKEEQRRLKEQITTETGFERVAELLAGAMQNNLKRPAITFALLDENGEKMGGNVVFRTTQQTANIIEVTNRAKRDRWTTTYGIIDCNGGTFPYNGLCPDAVVRFARYVAEDPEAAAVENGMLTGNCCFCAAGLHDHRSTAVGYGPVCAKRYSLPWSEEVYRERLALRVLRLQSVRSIRDGENEDALHTVETITCEGCNQYVLHPVDYDREVRNETDPETWACRNGCNGHTYFDETEDKCEARFVVDTSEFLKGQYGNLTGVKSGTYDVAPRNITGITATGDTDGDKTTISPGKTYPCDGCGKVYQSYAGRYNHIRKGQCPETLNHS